MCVGHDSSSHVIDRKVTGQGQGIGLGLSTEY